MLRLNQEHILLIGDTARDFEPVLSQAAPAARVTRVDNVFDAIAELSTNGFTAIVASAEPIERRPEAAIRTLRELIGDGRIILFGHPTLEPVARKMLEFGCDDYVVTPPNPSELQQIFGAPLMRLAPQNGYNGAAGHEPGAQRGQTVGDMPLTNPDLADGHIGSNGAASHDGVASVLRSVPLADVMLDALVQNPGAGPAAAVKAINAIINPSFELLYQPNGQDPLSVEQFSSVHSLPVRVGNESVAHLHLGARAEADAPNHDAPMRHFLSHAATALGKAAALQDRHNRLYKLAITDQLTGVYNRRHFELFLASILERAKAMRFQVTLLLFDIDNFKKYNDECGHALGDEILKETAGLMRTCCREHDLVARIGGDEFAVVFWEKELPRQPKDPARPVAPGRVPQEPLQILQRFRNTISKKEFSGLGMNGRGILTISGGLASFPWDGRTVTELVEAADRALTFGAKKGGKNSIYLVGGDAQKWEEEKDESKP